MAKAPFQPNTLEKHIANDTKYAFTLLSYALISIAYINLNTIRSAGLGIVVFISYFLINGIFLAYAFFEKEDRFFRLIFGVLALIMLLGLVGWTIMIIYNLDVLEFTLVLFIVSTIASFLNKRKKTKNAT